MCGIVGAVAERNVVEILLEGLKRLEYRGYDSAGVALLQTDGNLTRIRRTGKVQESRRRCQWRSPRQYWYCTHALGHPWWCNRGQCSPSLF